jgi:hypothetical protein
MSVVAERVLWVSLGVIVIALLVIGSMAVVSLQEARVPAPAIVEPTGGADVHLLVVNDSLVQDVEAGVHG